MNLCGAQWLAYALPCRRFAAALTDLHARLRVDVGRYSFIVSDLHRLLVAGLPTHCERFWTLPLETPPRRQDRFPVPVSFTPLHQRNSHGTPPPTRGCRPPELNSARRVPFTYRVFQPPTPSTSLSASCGPHVPGSYSYIGLGP